MVVDLSNTRAIAAGAMLAYATETLQAVKNYNEGATGRNCTYQGPCAIGVSLTPEQRFDFDGNAEWDDSVGIYGILEDGRAIGSPVALQELQTAHDMFAQDPFSEQSHLEFLIVTTFYAMGLDS